MLNDEVSVRVGLTHHQKFLLKKVDGDHVIHGVGKGDDGVQAADVVLNERRGHKGVALQ